MKLTCAVLTHNEENRLPSFLRHAERWADEILVADKASTDGTRRIASDHHCKLVSLPFSRAGFENPNDYIQQARNEWVFVMSPGEVPTPDLISTAMALLDSEGDSLDLVYIPKKLYSFGIHDTASPWSVSMQPFLLNKHRAIITDHIHRNFQPGHPSRAKGIPFSDTCHVLHPTHSTLEAFLGSHMDYILAEAKGCDDPERKMAEAFEAVRAFDFGGPKPELSVQWLAWRFYWTGVALAVADKMHNGDVPARYVALTQSALEEWL